MHAGERGTETMILTMIEPRLLIRLGFAASIVGHLALSFGLLFADAHPFESMPAEAIAIDIVAPEQAKPIPEAAKPPPAPEPKAPDPIDLSALTAPVKPTTSLEPPGQQASQKSQAAAAPAAQPAPASAPPAATPQATEASQPPRGTEHD